VATPAGLVANSTHIDVSRHYGPYGSLLLAGIVTAVYRYLVARAVARIETAGGCVLAVIIDSLIVACTHKAEPELVCCPAGRARAGRREAIWALPTREIEALVDVDDRLLRPEGGHVWKREAGFDRPLIAYVAGIYRYALINPAGGPSVASVPGLDNIYDDPTGSGQKTADGRSCWAVEAALAVARAGLAWDGRWPVPPVQLADWGGEPALRRALARTPEQLDRLSSAYPERRLRPFVPYWQVVLDRRRTLTSVSLTGLSPARSARPTAGRRLPKPADWAADGAHYRVSASARQVASADHHRRAS
jgi:hypothetical protein